MMSVRKQPAKPPSDGNIIFNAGNPPENLRQSTDVILQIVAACQTEATAVAALKTLRHLSKAPSAVHLTGCTFSVGGKR
jgi:hypothetical protein